MKKSLSRCVPFLFLMPVFGLSQVQQEHHQVDLTKEAEFPVRGLYRRLASQQIEGFPTPNTMKVLSLYLSDSLIRRINQARACHDDWFRLHPKNDEKAPSTWTEFGLFSGADDRGHPQAFQVEKTESDEDGSFRVYVKLTEGPQEKPWNWEVAAIVIAENGRYAINDVIFLKDKDVETESRLSEILPRGCDGSHWVGFDNKNAKP